MSKICWWVKSNEWNPAAVGGQKQPDAATGWRSVNVIGLDTSSSSPSCSSAHSRFKNLFVQLSPASSYLVTQDWCNRMQSNSLAPSLTHSLPPSTDLLFLLSIHSSLAFSVADHHSRPFFSSSLCISPSAWLSNVHSLSLSLVLSADLILCPRMAEDAVFRWTFAAEPDKAHTVLEGDAGYLQWAILLMVAFN